MERVLRIGVDFDNTIAGYDQAFARAAREAGLGDDELVGSKKTIRDAIRRLPEGEIEWQRLQGQVYGRLMPQAVLVDGVGEFLSRCRRRRVPVNVISHKTEYGHHDPSRVNLRDAARQWMADQGFFARNGFAIPPENVFFEDTRQDKIARIAALGCSHFIDDLEEVFQESSFPPNVARYLLAVGTQRLPQGPFTACRTWTEIADEILGPGS